MSNIQIYADYSDRLKSNSYDTNRLTSPTLFLCTHDTAGPNDFNKPGQSAVQGQILSNAAALYLAGNDRQASVHWLIGAESCGAPIYRIVPENWTAYHCGGLDGAPSHWQDPDTKKDYYGYDNNLVAIGVERLGQPNDTVGPNQQAALHVLVNDILTRHANLKNPLRVVAHANIDPNRTDGMTWRDMARKWVIGVNDNLPYGAIQDTSGNLHINGFVVGYGFLSYYLTLGANLQQGELGAAINRAVREYGLPLTNETVDPVTGITYQYFERYCLQYNPKAPDGWKTIGRDIGRLYLAVKPPV